MNRKNYEEKKDYQESVQLVKEFIDEVTNYKQSSTF